MTGETWLAARLAGAPAELGAAIRDLVDAEDLARASDAGPLAERLAAAALAGFEGVLAETAADRKSRTAALRLLAADAVLTCAFEAAAEPGGDPWGLGERLGPAGALGERLAPGRGARAPSRSTSGGGGS